MCLTSLILFFPTLQNVAIHVFKLTSLILFFPTLQKLFALCRLKKYQEAEELAEEESGHMDKVRHREGVGNSNRVCTSTALLTSSGFLILSSLKPKVWEK